MKTDGHNLEELEQLIKDLEAILKAFTTKEVLLKKDFFEGYINFILDEISELKKRIDELKRG